MAGTGVLFSFSFHRSVPFFPSFTTGTDRLQRPELQYTLCDGSSTTRNGPCISKRRTAATITCPLRRNGPRPTDPRAGRVGGIITQDTLLQRTAAAASVAARRAVNASYIERRASRPLSGSV